MDQISVDDDDDDDDERPVLETGVDGTVSANSLDRRPPPLAGDALCNLSFLRSADKDTGAPFTALDPPEPKFFELAATCFRINLFSSL